MPNRKSIGAVQISQSHWWVADGMIWIFMMTTFGPALICDRDSDPVEDQ